MKKIYFILSLVIFNSLNALERLPERALDISLGEDSGNHYWQLVDYNVEKQKLENVILINYEREDELARRLQGINRDFAQYNIEIKERGVSLLDNFDPKKYMIRIPDTHTITPSTYQEHYLLSTNTVYDVSRTKEIKHTIYRSDVVMNGSTLAEFLFHRSPKYMMQKTRPSFEVTLGEERLPLAALENDRHPLIKRLGGILTELTLISRGYNQVLTYNMDGTIYSVFKSTVASSDDAPMYFITTSVCSQKYDTARKIAEDKLQSQHALALIERLNGIDPLKEEVASLSHCVTINSHSAFLFVHRTVGTGRSQSFIQTTEDLRLARLQSPESRSKLERLKTEGIELQEKASIIEKRIAVLQEKIKFDKEKWQALYGSQDEEDTAGCEEDVAGSSSGFYESQEDAAECSLFAKMVLDPADPPE